MLDEKQPDLYSDMEPSPEPEKDPFEALVLSLAENWKNRRKEIDLIFFLSACGRHRPALAKLPEPMRAKEEIPMLKRAMEILDEAKIKFTRAQVIKYMEKLSKIAPKKTESDWKNRKDLY